MSGHSHYATIKRQKEAKDAAKGKIFSKMARAITIAAKTGGGADPSANYKLRMTIEAAKSANMPKSNIERALSKASGGESLDEVTYEGFGPAGIAVMVDVATDNRNRSAQEIKNIFERGGGSMSGPGSVAFNFESVGLIVVGKKGSVDEQILKMIDVGAEDVEETDSGIEIYTKPDALSSVSEKIKSDGYDVLSVELYQRPKNKVSLTDERNAKKALDMLEKFEEHEDVQKVYSNLDIPQNVLENMVSN
jgi:YebC/PmpR family DNA-binding regulatory protein